MTRDVFNNIVERRLSLIKVLLLQKGQEYSTTSDVFHNFNAATGLSFHKSPEKVAWEFAVKHFQSIKDILDKTENEDFSVNPIMIEEKLGDAINYLILIEGMLKNRINK
jgi:hypothetical protein